MADCSPISARIAALEAAIPKLQVYLANLAQPGIRLTAEQAAQRTAYATRLDAYQRELSAKRDALAVCQRALPSPIVPPPPVGTCELDLLTATASQIAAYCRCTNPTGTAAQWADCTRATTDTQTLLRRAQDVLGPLLPVVGGVAGDVSAAVSGALGGIVAELADFLSGLRLALAEIDAQAAEASAGPLDAIVNVVIGGLNDLLGGAGDTLAGANAAVFGSIESLLGGAADTLGGIVGSVAAGVGDVVGSAADTIGSLVGAAVGGIEDVVGTAAGVVSFVGTGIVDSIADTLRITNDLIGDAGDAVRFVASGLADSLARTADIIGDVVGGAPAFIDQLLTEVLPAIVESAGGVAEGLAALLGDPVKGIIGGFLHGEEPDIVATVEGVYARMERNPELPAEVRGILGMARRTDRPLPAIIGVLIIPLALSTIASAIFGPVAQLIVQEENRAVRPTRLSLGDAVSAAQRELADAGYVADIGARAGYPDADIALAVKLGEQQPTLTDLVTMYHREVISEGDLVARFRRLGYTAADAAALAGIAPVIPPLSDLVRFAVREAFPGQTGFGGARGSGVPGGFVTAAKHLGLSPEFAQSYWAAHWELPSVGQVFEMYHRGIIDEAILRAYLVEADVAPEWRDRLTAISFNPLTRVDVRRMFATGVIGAGELQQAYEDIGYSPANAARLRDFTITLTSGEDDEASKPERDLTKGDLVGAYNDGILDRGRLLSSLSDIGYDSAEAELIAARADMAAALARRREVKAAVVAGGKSGALSIPEVEAQLAAAGFKAGEVTTVVNTITDARSAKTAFPSKADLFAFSKAALIDEAELSAALAELGYHEPWLERYLALAKAKLLPQPEA